MYAIRSYYVHDPTTADRLLGIIRAKGVLPTQLEVEITESSILNNFELAREILTKLRSEGLLIVLDDFGTAYSSLNLLLKIPVITSYSIHYTKLYEADVGAVITVVASYTDDLGTDEMVNSSATAAVANVNDPPTGSVTIDRNNFV